jgi:peptidylprolyl isomerase
MNLALLTNTVSRASNVCRFKTLLLRMKIKSSKLVVVRASAIALSCAHAQAAQSEAEAAKQRTTAVIDALKNASKGIIKLKYGPAKVVTVPFDLKYENVKVSTSAEAKSGQNATVYHTGWLRVSGKKDNKFDFSKDHGQPFSFLLGGDRVIKGWDEGVQGMKPRGAYILTLPPAIGYSGHRVGGVMPPGAALLFEADCWALSN